MNDCEVVAVTRPGNTPALNPAQRVLRVTQVAWLGTTTREHPAAGIRNRKTDFKRASIQHTYLRLLLLEI